MILCVLFISHHTWAAGGVFHPPHGAQPMGWAGAVSAGEASLHAGWYNPALTANLPRSSALIDLTLVVPLHTFTRSPQRMNSGETVNYPSVQNEAPPSFVPQLALSHNFGLDQWRLSLHGFAPQGVSSSYPVDGPQRYQHVDNQGSFIWIMSVNIAYRPSPHLWLGVALVNTSVSVRQYIVTSAYPGFLGSAESAEFDVLVFTEGRDLMSLTAQAGLRASWGALSFGASVWLPTQVEINELTLKQRLPSHPLFDGAFVQGDQAATHFSLPLIARAGLRWTESRWALEVDGVYEQHHHLSEIKTTPKDVVVRNVTQSLDFEVTPSVIPKDLRDIWSVRLGGEWRPHAKPLTAQSSSQGWSWTPHALRLGVLFEQGAVPDHTMNILTFDADKWGICAGATWAGPSMALDIGYTALLLQDRFITQSSIKQVNPLNSEGALSVGMGLYEGQVHLISLGVRFNSEPNHFYP